ncbi:hypothetical protein SUGI_0808390 [Cryptomeria japonica]|nr:hypothetical protein SUGI_0808390 [Cryptomeria japonica]
MAILAGHCGSSGHGKDVQRLMHVLRKSAAQRRSRPCTHMVAVIFVLLQLFAIALFYSQVAYEIMEKKSADVKKGIFAARNLILRLFLRTVYIVICAVIAAMLPFFGDINALVGAIGFITLDFILPMLLYYKSFKLAPNSSIYQINNAIMVIFTGVGIMGAISSVRQIAIDAKHFHIFSNNVLD